MDEGAYLKAYRILTMFAQLEDPTPDLRMRFLEWLADKSNEAEKEAALKTVFDQIMGG